MITIQQLAEWITLHRRGMAFKGYTFEHIINQLCDCAKEQSMRCVTEKGEIVGVCCGAFNHKSKTLYVYDILTTKQGVVKRMMNDFISLWPGYTIQGRHRSGRERNFTNPIKLTHRL